MIYVRDIIQTIVESIRSTGSVSSWVDNTGSYTITTASTGNLEVGFKVVLIYADTTLNRDVIITAVTSTTFTYSGTGITEPASWQMALYFEVGHRLELNKLYTNKAKSTNKLVQEYPLFWLYTDFQKNKGDGEYTAFETSLQAAIADFSVKNKYEAERITDKFKPVLYPYFELIETAFNTGTNKRNFVTAFGEDNQIRFEPIDRPFFGSADEVKNVLPQVTDAIEFEVDLKWMIEKCISGVVKSAPSTILTATSYQTSLAEVGITMSFTDPLDSINFGDDSPNESLVTDVEKTHDYSYLGRYDISIISASVDATKLVFDNSQLIALNIAKLINLTYLDLNTNSLSDFSIVQFTELIYLDLSNNGILSADVDTILSLLDGFGKSNGTLFIVNGNDERTAASNQNAINLTAKGWKMDIGLVKVNMYRDISTSGGTIGVTSGGRSWIISAQDTFVRQNGNISKIKMYVEDNVGLNEFYFYIWRLRPDLDYDKIHQTDILTKIQAAGTGIIEIEFDTPLAVQEGDRFGLGYKGLEGTVINKWPSDTSTAKPLLYQNSIISDSVYDWNAALSLQVSTEIECYMSPPNIVMLGDSIGAGHTDHFTYIEQTLSFGDDIENQIPYQLGALNSNYTPYQNMSLGGNRADEVLSRVQADAINLNPRNVFLNAGVNDLAASRTNIDIIADIENTIIALQAVNIIPILLEVAPWTSGTNTQMQQRDLLNVLIQGLAATYGIQSVNLDSALGLFRVGGDVGNLWDIKVSYDEDGVHFNKDGYIAYATEINNNI